MLSRFEVFELSLSVPRDTYCFELSLVHSRPRASSSWVKMGVEEEVAGRVLTGTDWAGAR